MHSIFAFGLPHGSEWLWIFLAIVVLFGAEKIPKLAKGLGKSLGEFKKAKDEFEKEVNAASLEQDKKPALDQTKISGNLPEPIHPIQTSGATSVDELTKKS
jgi:TatA/E family protein of Tat protein translocase